jgi:uncharacterized membrane protein
MIRRGLLASIACFVAIVAIWFWAAAHIDPAASVPVHWGPSGPDRYATGAEALRYFALFPAAVAAVAILFALAPRFEPFRRNLQMGERAFLTTWIGTNLLFVAIAFVFAREMTRTTPLTDQPDIWWRAIIAGSFLLIVAIADVMPKTRRNFLLGFRTRWTLSSDLAWEKTHRLAGRLLILVGLWGVAAAFLLDIRWLAVAITIPILAVVVFCTVYSYRVWRDDPNKSVGDIEHA